MVFSPRGIDGGENEYVVSTVVVFSIKLERKGCFRCDIVADLHKCSFKVICDARSQRDGPITGENSLVALFEEQTDLRAFPFLGDFPLFDNGFQHGPELRFRTHEAVEWDAIASLLHIHRWLKLWHGFCRFFEERGALVKDVWVRSESLI